MYHALVGENLMKQLAFAALCTLALTAVACSGSSQTQNPLGECTQPGIYICQDSNNLFICSSADQWVFFKDCSLMDQVCYNGACTDSGPCQAGAKRCTAVTQVEVCNTQGAWETLVDCADAGKVCDGGSCTGCFPGTYRCRPDNQSEIQLCGDSGAWAYYRDCATDGLSCDSGICIGAHVDGDGETSLEQEEESGVFCDDATPCTDSQSYCFKPDGAASGQCLKYCDLESNCPLGYTCSTTTYQCERLDGFCTSGGQCQNGREFCDKITGQDYGVCKTFCYLPGESCPAGSRCCMQTDTTAECAVKIGKCIPTQASCYPCYSDFDCGDTNYCLKFAGQNLGCCKPKCFSNDDCTGEYVCLADGRCGKGNGQGDCGGSCPAGYVCDPIYDECVLNCPACGLHECCNALSAPDCITCECLNPTVCGLGMEQCCFGYTCFLVEGLWGICL